MNSSSKRGRGDKDAPTPTKEAKVDVTKAAEKEEGVEGCLAVKEAEAEAEVLRWSGVDEEMTWANCWLPFWEVQAPGDAYESLYGDVWDYDIWGFKNAHNFPLKYY
ncbi:hypothetical protein AAHA92_14245 [Salvia divinorum]|uniref:Uncharacterized protein n=1 Tax=Salvia divinorum TaxID=28513 RepID=A0ABD1HAX1_SALDI